MSFFNNLLILESVYLWMQTLFFSIKYEYMKRLAKGGVLS